MTIKKIKTYYSKPSSNIEIESVNIRHNASESYKEQKRVSKFLDSFSLRKTCVCCGSKMDGVKFTHRDISFIEWPKIGSPIERNACANSSIEFFLDIKPAKKCISATFL